MRPRSNYSQVNRPTLGASPQGFGQAKPAGFFDFLGDIISPIPIIGPIVDTIRGKDRGNGRRIGDDARRYIDRSIDQKFNRDDYRFRDRVDRDDYGQRKYIDAVWDRNYRKDQREEWSALGLTPQEMLGAGGVAASSGTGSSGGSQLGNSQALTQAGQTQAAIEDKERDRETQVTLGQIQADAQVKVAQINAGAQLGFNPDGSIDSPSAQRMLAQAQQAMAQAGVSQRQIQQVDAQTAQIAVQTANLLSEGKMLQARAMFSKAFAEADLSAKQQANIGTALLTWWDNPDDGNWYAFVSQLQIHLGTPVDSAVYAALLPTLLLDRSLGGQRNLTSKQKTHLQKLIKKNSKSKSIPDPTYKPTPTYTPDPPLHRF